MSINALAKEVGLSPSTIYRALSRPGLVSSEALRNIHNAARSMNIDLQKKSHRGRPLKSEGSNPNLKKLGLWFVGIDENRANRYMSAQIALVRIACAQAGLSHHFIFSSSADEVPVEISQRAVDMVLLEGSIPGKEAMEQLGRIPSVWILTRKSKNYPGDYVEPDNEANGQMAADFLSSNGHRHVAYVTTEPHHPAFARRQDSFLEHCAQLGMNAKNLARSVYESTKHPQPPPTEEKEDELADSLLSLNPNPTGIYLPSEHAVGAIYRGLRRKGKDPARFDWILGNYDSYVWPQLDPLPAVIDVNFRTILNTAVKIAAWRAQERDLTGRIGISIGPTLFSNGRKSS
jgi:DNA-binding LacI/PurR family transcriptional regulator